MNAGYFYCPYIPLVSSPLVKDNKTVKLSHWDIKRYRKAVETLAHDGMKIQDRVDEVLALIHNTLGHTLSSWWFPNANEGEVGTPDVDSLARGEWIEVELIENYNDLLVGGVNFNYGIPANYLFMDNSKIVEEVLALSEDG